MALATQCPHCGTVFRVAADQLKLRGGIVRCGACQQVFDGNRGLVDLSAAPATPPAPVPSGPASGPSPAAAAEPSLEAPAAQAGEVPIYTLAFDRTFAPFGILPQATEGDAAPAGGERAEASGIVAQQPEPDTQAHQAVQPEPAQAAAPVAEPGDSIEAPGVEAPLAEVPVADTPAVEAAPAPAGAAVLDLPVDEALVAAPPPDDGLDPEPAPHAEAAPARPDRADAPPLLLRESTGGQAPIMPPAPPPKSPRVRAAESRARRSKLTPTRIEPPKLRVPEPDEPEFVRRGRQREQSGKTVRIAMAAGSVLLLLALAAQAVSSFGDVLAARYPAMRPALVSGCALLGCRIELPARIDQLAIETGELTTLGGNAYTLSTLLRNQGDLVLAWPSIELTLSDADDKPLVRRVFGPRDYLPPGAAPATGFGARAEQPVKLHFRLEDLTPSGYHIAVFYP